MTDAKLIKHILKIIDELKDRMSKLEKDSHPKRDFVLCNKCKNAIKQYEGTD